MPQKISLPFQTVQLRLSTGEVVSFPLSDPNAYQLGQTSEALAANFAASFQENQLDKGHHLAMLDLVHSGDFQIGKISIPIPPAPDGISYPDFSLEFDTIQQKRGDQCWGMVPALGLSSQASTMEDLEKGLIEVVRIEFSAKKRLHSVFQIIAANWFEGIALSSHTIQLVAWSPAELADQQKHKKQQILAKVAQKMVIETAVAYGRETELGQMERALKGRFGRNLLLVGPSGVGKTVLVQELAYRRVSLEIEPEFWETTAAILIKELTSDTGWQDNLSLLVEELTQAGPILFVGNLAALFEVGRYEGNSVSVAEYLRSAIGRGEVTLIAECTPEERARIELKNPGYLSFFQTVELNEPRQGLEGIILQKVNGIAAKHGMEVDPAAIQEIIRLSKRFTPYSGLPGRPIRFLESMLLALAEKPISEKKKKPKAQEPTTGTSRKIDKSQVIERFCEDSGLPPFMVNPAIPMDAFSLRRSFAAQVFGQEQAVSAVVDMLATVKTALSRSGKPIASFLFAGPTGVGKTEMAKVLAQVMFGNRDRMVRFDMSEYSNPWAVMRLIGDSYQSDGLLTSAVRRSPFCVLLFDEIEKADPKFFELLLQILGEGRLTDSQGRVVNFCSAIIIMTTNIGASNLFQNRISWKKEMGDLDYRQHFTSAIEKHFRPELYNRIDAIVAFAPLDQETMRYVVERELDLLKAREGIRHRPIDLAIAETVHQHLALAGYNAKFGARHLQRTIREQLAIPLAEALNGYAFDERLHVRVDMRDGSIHVSVEDDPMAFDLLMAKWDSYTLAEKTSHQRRKLALMMESPLFLRFLGELDLLENEKKKQKDQYYLNEAKAKQHAPLAATNQKVRDLLEEVQALEVEIALHCMGQEAIDETFSEQLEGWETAFFETQIKLHSLIYPKRNTCRMAFFGTKLQGVIQVYAPIFKAKGFSIQSIETVWYREGFRPLESQTPEEGEVAYLRLKSPTLALDQLSLLPAAPNDLLCGIEVELEGPCAWLFFKEEKGFQVFATKDHTEMAMVYVQPTLAKPKVPGEVHRQSFYANGKPRRKIGAGQFTDSKYGIQGQIVPNQPIEALLSKLDEQFKDAVARAFLDTEGEDQ